MKQFNYVYRLTHLPTNTHYIGSRASNRPPVEDLGVRYFTSSGIVKPMFKLSPQDFHRKLLKVFPTYRQAAWYEHRLLNKCGVPFNERFFNRSVVDHRGVVTRTGIFLPERGITLSIVRSFELARKIKCHNTRGCSTNKRRKNLARSAVWKGNTERAIASWHKTI